MRFGITQAALCGVGFLGLVSWSAPQSAPAASQPRIETFTLKSEVFKNTRTIRVYLPEDYGRTRRSYPVLYLNDGFAVFKDSAWNAPATVQKLIAEKKVEEFILVGIDNGVTATPGSLEQRTREYLPYADPVNEPDMADPEGARYPQFLFEEVMPAVERRFRVSRKAEDTGIGGASYGGLISLYTVIGHPGRFGRLLLESTPLFIADARVLKEAQTAKQWPARVYLGVGTKETSDAELMRAGAHFRSQFKGQILKTSPNSKIRIFVEEGGTHTSASWRRRLPVALEFLYPYSSDTPAVPPRPQP